MVLIEKITSSSARNSPLYLLIFGSGDFQGFQESADPDATKLSFKMKM